MRQDLTDITLVVDRSGSMSSCKQEAQMGINAFINEQKKAEGEAVFSLLQFDTSHEYVFNAVPIDQVGEYKLEPRGMTALLDAVGKVINETGQRLEKTPETDRPALVIVAIITDGEENASNEFSRHAIKEMVERQQNEYNWQFTFLGANIDAFAEASSIGIDSNAIASYCVTQSINAYSGLASNITKMRKASFIGEVVSNYYTDEERKNMTN